MTYDYHLMSGERDIQQSKHLIGFVPCWNVERTIRNGNGISEDVIEDTIEKDSIDCFPSNNRKNRSFDVMTYDYHLMSGERDIQQSKHLIGFVPCWNEFL
jgi:hypothetical protein